MPQRHVQHVGIKQWTRSRREATGQAFAGLFPGMFPAHRQGAWAESQLVPASHRPQAAPSRDSAPEPPASTKGGYNKPRGDRVLGSSQNSSPCSAAIPIFDFLAEKPGTDHGGRYLGVAASREAAFRLRVPRDGISGFPISIPATEPGSAKPRRRTHARNCTIKRCVSTAILSRRKQLPVIPWGLNDQCVFRQWMGLCLFSFSFS